jgi:hypothetical protein
MHRLKYVNESETESGCSERVQSSNTLGLGQQTLLTNDEGIEASLSQGIGQCTNNLFEKR